MDKIIDTARSFGKVIQNDERYIRYQLIRQANEEDSELKEHIEAFNNIRNQFNEMAQSEEDAREKVQKEMQELYEKIMSNSNMIALTEAQEEINGLMSFINQIISASFNGMDPSTIEQSQGCQGSCGGCAGC